MKTWLFGLALGTLAPNVPALAQENAPATASDTVPFRWELVFQPGQKWLQTTETITRQEQSMPFGAGARGDQPLNLEIEARSRYVIEQNVVALDERGAQIELFYRALSQSSTARQDGKTLTASGEDAALNKVLKAVQGTRISYRVTPGGEISEIRGLETYLNRLMDAVTVSPELESPAMKKALKDTFAQVFTPETLKTSMAQSYRLMPSRPIAPGQSWRYSTGVPMMNTTFTQNGQIRFVSRQGGRVTLREAGTISLGNAGRFSIPFPDVPRPPKFRFYLRGTSQSEMEVEEATGATLQTRMTQNIAGKVVMSGLPEGMPGGVKTLGVPIKMSIVTRMTLREITAK